MDLGVQAGVVEKSGSWFSHEGQRIGQGRENAKQFLKDNPLIADTIERSIRANAGLVANKMMIAGADGPAWLIAGNGHVRTDLAVPRILARVAPGKRVLVVGWLEREENGAAPEAAERQRYDLVVVTPRTPRPDPCLSLGR